MVGIPDKVVGVCDPLEEVIVVTIRMKQQITIM